MTSENASLKTREAKAIRAAGQNGRRTRAAWPTRLSGWSCWVAKALCGCRSRRLFRCLSKVEDVRAALREGWIPAVSGAHSAGNGR